MYRRKIFASVLLSATFMLAVRADAAILFTTGAMAEIFTPVSFVEGASESSTGIAVLDEGITVLSADVEVNVYGVGTFGDEPGPYLIVPAGTRVNSYLVHFDPIGGSLATLTGAVFFDPGETIIGIQTHAPLLYTTDVPLGHPDAIYPGVFVSTRAFETFPGPDSVTIAPGLGSASFTLFAELGVDQARILTLAPVPEPSSIALAAMALAAMALAAVALVSRRRARPLAI